MSGICSQESFETYRNRCYDLTLNCEGPNLFCNDNGDLVLSNSLRTRIYLIMGTCRNNFMNLPFLDWDILNSAPLNSSGILLIRNELETKFSSFLDEIEINVSLSKNRCFLISINILDEDFNISFSNTNCFTDVLNSGFDI